MKGGCQGQSSIVANKGNGIFVAHQVITLSGTGDAETPAGGSVCIRYCELSAPKSSVATRRLCERTLKSRMRRLLAAVDMMAALGEVWCYFESRWLGDPGRLQDEAKGGNGRLVFYLVCVR